MREHITRDEAIQRIRAGLKARSDRQWSVTGGRGTAWGWITIHAPPRRRTQWGYLFADDQDELARLLGLSRPVHMQGQRIPSGSDEYQEYIDRAEGRVPSVKGRIDG